MANTRRGGVVCCLCLVRILWRVLLFPWRVQACSSDDDAISDIMVSSAMTNAIRTRQTTTTNRRSTAVLVGIGLFISIFFFFIVNFVKRNGGIQKQKSSKWHGGHPADDRRGSCWCSNDEYCMCTPSVAIDIVLYSKSSKSDEIMDDYNTYSVWVVRRGDTGQLATIGGFVEVGETTEHAVVREVEEETGIIIPSNIANTVMNLIGVYSDPRRDNRRHIVSVAYALEFKPNIMKTTNDSGIPKAGDDAKEVISIPLDEIGVKYIGDDWFDDHLTILLDFKERISNNKRYELVNRNGELYQNIVRSTCASF